MKRYAQWSRLSPKLLWILVIIGLAASLPLAADRYRTEQTSKKVEFVFDYRDLLEISDYKPNPRQFVADQLAEMKKRGIQSLAIYESTLNELKLSRRIELYNAHDAAALSQTPVSPTENYTYVLFTEPQSQAEIKDLIERSFARLNVKTAPWSVKNQQGLVIQLPLDEASAKSMDPDPIALRTIKDLGFRVVPRLSNRRPLDPAEMDRLLQRLEDAGARTIIVDGDATATVPGYSNVDPGVSSVNSLKMMADLMKKHHMGLATIEIILKTPQKGYTTLAKSLDYNVLRLHSFTENDASKLTENLTKQDLEARIQGVADRFVLAVKDRNIRMIFLNARATKSLDKGTFVDPLSAIYESLTGKNGAMKRIENAGYTLGQAHAFDKSDAGWRKALKPLVVLGGVSLIALVISYFSLLLTAPLFVLGLLGAAALNVLSANALYKLLALGVGVFAASLAVILAIRRLRAVRAKASPGAAIVRSIGLLVAVSVVSLIGAAYIVGLLNDITYNLLLDQFKGVKILAYLPIVIAAVYLLVFSEELTPAGRFAKVRRMLGSPITVLWVLTAVVIGVAGIYYLSRTGNEGSVSSGELVFRSFLENTLGVRPRTKEFLIGHPAFLLGAYLVWRKQKWGLYLLLIGVVAQADMIGTFTHLHTPLDISAIRDIYGGIGGVLIGLVAIAVWEVCARSWNRWGRLLKES